MTTIAFDGKYLAADRQITGGVTGNAPYISGYKCKLHIITWNGQKVALAMGGRELDCLKFLNWLSKPSPTYPKLGENFTALAVFEDGRASVYFDDSDGIPQPVGPKHSLGAAGFDFARGAMAAGKWAPEAVALACNYCVYTGGGVDYVDIADMKIRTYNPSNFPPSAEDIEIEDKQAAGLDVLYPIEEQPNDA